MTIITGCAIDSSRAQKASHRGEPMTADEEFRVGAECSAPPANSTVGKGCVQRRARLFSSALGRRLRKRFTTGKVRAK